MGGRWDAGEDHTCSQTGLIHSMVHPFASTILGISINSCIKQGYLQVLLYSSNYMHSYLHHRSLIFHPTLYHLDAPHLGATTFTHSHLQTWANASCSPVMYIRRCLGSYTHTYAEITKSNKMQEPGFGVRWIWVGIPHHSLLAGDFGHITHSFWASVSSLVKKDCVRII